MNFNEYQKKSFSAIQGHNDNKEEVMHWAIGLGEECGEALSVIKHKYYAGSYDPIDLVEELGDLLWYLAALCTASGFNFEDVAAFNLAKMDFRYPKGDFDEQRSKDRHSLKYSDEWQNIVERFRKIITEEKR